MKSGSSSKAREEFEKKVAGLIDGSDKSQIEIAERSATRMRTSLPCSKKGLPGFRRTGSFRLLLRPANLRRDCSGSG